MTAMPNSRRLMALLLEEEVPLPEALRLTSIALQGTVLARPCRTAAAAVEEGTPLDQALAVAGFPDSLTVLVAWGQQKTCLAEAFRAAAEAFEARTNSQSALLNMLVLPMIYMLIVTFVGFTIIALMMPLMSLISNLSGGHVMPCMNDDLIAILMLASYAGFPVGRSDAHGDPWFTGPAPGDRKPIYVTVIRAFAWILTAVGFVVGISWSCPDWQSSGSRPWPSSSPWPIASRWRRSNMPCWPWWARRPSDRCRWRRPLPPSGANAAAGCGGGRRKSSTCSTTAPPLPAALKAVPGALPPEAVPLVCVGHENGSLGPAIAQAIAARNLV